MLLLLSPAKRLNFTANCSYSDCSPPAALAETSALISVLKKYSPSQLGQLMKLSPDLAQLNYQRFHDFDPENFNEKNAKPAIYAFEGDVYRSLDIKSFSKTQLDYLQQHLLILSGLYGYLRPLDLMQPYRLEMGTALQVGGSHNLYQFWKNKIVEGINANIRQQGHAQIINLASDEYFKAVDASKLIAPLLSISFKERRGDRYQTIGINAKKARGSMTRFIALNRIANSEELKDFNLENYKFSKEFSDKDQLVFIRKPKNGSCLRSEMD